MVSEISHVRSAFVVTLVVWWSPVCGKEPKDIIQGDFGLNHLIYPLFRCKKVHIHVAPSMSRDLVSFFVRPSDRRWKLSCGVIDLALVDVVTGDEKRCLCVIGLENVE